MIKRMAEFLYKAALRRKTEKKKGTKILSKTIPIEVMRNIGSAVVLNKEVKIYNSSVTVGDYSYINGGRFWYCTIGKFCSLGYDIAIGAGEHRIDTVTTYPVHSRLLFSNKMQKEDFNEQRVARIGNGVWIGNRAIIKQGVTIGDGAVIGAGSVVTHDVPPYTICCGVPARKIKDLFSEEDKDFLLSTNWFNWNRERIERALVKGAFESIEAFKEFVNNDLGKSI